MQYASFWYLFIGFLLGNGMPHFLFGAAGKIFRTPFGRESSARVNVIWGLCNFVLASAFLGWRLTVQSPQMQDLVFLFAGFWLVVLLSGASIQRLAGGKGHPRTKRSPSGDRSKFVVMGAVMLAMLLSALDQTIVATAMPRIVEELQGLSRLSWVFTAYMLTSTISIPIYGKLSDMYGRRGFFLGGIVIFLAGSALSGLSQDMTQLIMFRGLQGIGSGAIMVNAIAVIGDLFPPSERGKWQGLIGAVFGFASVAGPLLGGWVTEISSWRWVFYINIPLGILAIAVIASTLPSAKKHAFKRSLDYAGAFFLALGLVPLLLALVWGGSQYAWTSFEILWLFALSAAALYTFVQAEHYVKEPILPLFLFKNRAFVVSAIAVLISAMGMYGAILYIPLFAQGVIGFSPTNSGLALVPMMGGMVIASAAGGQFISRTGKYKLLAFLGMIIASTGMYLLSRMTPDTSQLSLIFNMATTGIGLGMTMPIFNVVVQNAFDHSKLGVVSASSQLFRSIGGTVGAAIFGGLLNSEIAGKLPDLQRDPFLQGLQKISPAAFSQLNANTLQNLLTPDGQARLQHMLGALPLSLQAQLVPEMNHFLQAVRLAFADSIATLFFVGAVIMVFAAIITIFLPHIELRKTNIPALEEAGMELELEFANADANYEPDLMQ